MLDPHIPSRSHRTRAVLATAAACLGAAVGAPLVIGAGDAPSARTSHTGSRPQPPAGDCPRDAWRLPPDGVAAAAEAALAAAPTIYGSAKNLNGMRIAQATWAPRDATRGAYARVKCSGRVQRRTVVVSLDFPKEKGASLREGIFLVSLGSAGYNVWAQLH